jgi:carbonic anhydrase
MDTLTRRNEAFASSRFSRGLKIVPSLKTLIVGCVDPRVDPVDVLGLALGEAAVIRNVGGRVTPDVIETWPSCAPSPKLAVASSDRDGT